ncbi:DUF6479 family protein [Streptomyces sp. NPDC096030]|uniref:DUF6479 family protein n=1 Tax=Streptomyces sp. NPDC096030 TaxID=3155423 RepID=UPI003319046B
MHAKGTPHLLEALVHILIGLIVVAVLVGSVVLGSKLRDQEGPPPDPTTHPHRPPTSRLPGEVSEHLRRVEVPKSDRAHRLRPYQLRTSTEPVPHEDA